MSKIEEYRRVRESADLPERRRVWEVPAAGVENLRLVQRPLPAPTDDEVTVRIDAVGICASDVKIINQGERHARLRGCDLSANPVTLGHEVALTVLRSGPVRRRQFPAGSRWTLNPDIYVEGLNTSYGFKIPGGYQEFQTLPGPVAAEYMLPLADHVGYAQAALTEPWACVYFAYTNHRPNQGVRPGGTAWYMGCGPVGMMHIEKGLADGAGRIVVSERNPARLERVRATLGAAAARRGTEMVLFNPDHTEPSAVMAPDGVDDIVILAPAPELVPQALSFLARNGVLNIFAGFPERDKSVLPVNFYDLHYKNAVIISTSGAGMDAMRRALADSTAGRVDPNRAVAAVGGLETVADAVAATRAASYPGRIVIYPQLQMPLTPVEALSPDGIWTCAAEESLFEERLGRGAAVP